ncbi:uncharacterized protein LOC124935012 [Impatiens glandulifera]|uniref:uncharacterized protein LOC124935012 n=1 Tax=Impatiens glandulifera TaxID=253017 RepID=UPI001FB0E266|nr:uncharacterized protein LOC124935012 [Impatiens glandulifera]
MSTSITKQSCSRQSSGKGLIFTDERKRNPATSSCRFRIPIRRSTTGLFPLRFLRQLGDKMAAALNLISGKTIRGRRNDSSPNGVVSSSAARSKPSVAPVLDSHRAEAINDCIEFIYSSSSLPRSDSVTAKERC